jgi:ribonuclease P protein component
VRDLAGRGWSTPLLVLYVAPNDLGSARFGITVSGRVGKAVVRNRVRRRLREAVRVHVGQVRPGLDLVLVARPAIVSATWAHICAAVDTLLQRANALAPAATQPAGTCV